MLLLANELDVPSVLHGQVSLAAVNQIFVNHETMNGCKKYEDSLKAFFENVFFLNEPMAFIQSLKWKRFSLI